MEIGKNYSVYSSEDDSLNGYGMLEKIDDLILSFSNGMQIPNNDQFYFVEH